MADCTPQDERGASSAARIRSWWHPGTDGAVTFTRFVVYWRGASPLWGFHRDARGLTLRLGRFSIYPKGC